MAAAHSLEENITCAVCFEIYRDPHALKCLHTFCLVCIKQIQKGSTILCPECRENTHIREVKDDFKTQAFIDLYNEHKSKSNPGGNPVSRQKSSGVATCEMCNKEDRTIRSKCVNCNQFMCEICSVTHSGITACQNHKVIPVQEAINLIHVGLKKNMAVLETDRHAVFQKSNQVSEQITGMHTLQANQVGEVNRLTDDLIRALDNHRKGINSAIYSEYDSLIDSLNIKKYHFDESVKSIQAKIDFLGELSQSDDITTLTGTTKTANESIQHGIRKIKENLPNIDSLLTSPVTIEKGMNLDLESVLSLKFKHPEICNKQVENNSNSKYFSLFKSSYNWERCIGISFYPLRLCLVQNFLWVAGWDGVYAFDIKTSCMTKTVQHPQMKNVRSLIKCHTEDFLVACSGTHGIFRLDATGKFQEKVAIGSFTDICTYKQKVYAIENETAKVIVFKCKLDNSWSKYKEFTDVEFCDRIRVNNDTLYVSSSKYNKILVYNLEGQLMYHTGEGGKRGGAGHLNHPLLCDVNSPGDMLVADYGNHRLQVRCHKGGKWHIVVLSGELRCPVDAVVDDQSKHIWLIKQHPSQLLKFSMRRKSSNSSSGSGHQNITSV